METEHLEFRVQVWRYWKGASVAVSLTPENYCNWQVWEVWGVWIRPSRPLHVFLMRIGMKNVALTMKKLLAGYIKRPSRFIVGSWQPSSQNGLLAHIPTTD